MRRLSAALPVLLATLSVAHAEPTSATCDVPAFSAPRGYDAGPDDGRGGRSLGSGDFNEDGLADLVAGEATNAVWVLLAAGDGTFTASTRFPLVMGPNSHEQRYPVADFNRDGHMDVAVATSDFSGSRSAIEVLLGDGTGALAAPRLVEFGTTEAYGLVAADFNGDGADDLAMVVQASTNAVVVMLADGTGGFAAPFVRPVNTLLGPLAAGDFDGDGHADLAVATVNIHGLVGAITVWLGNGAGGFAPPGPPQTVGVLPQSLVVGDINDDGLLDVVTSNFGEPSSDVAEPTLSVALGDGLGGFSRRDEYPLSDSPGSMSVADVNGDGRLDLLVSATRRPASAVTIGYLLVLLQNATGTLADPTFVLMGETAGILEVGHFDQDGRPDIAAAYTFNPWDELDRDVLVLRNLCGNIADLALAAQDTPDPAVAGLRLTYTVEITNHGPDLAGGVVTATMPSGVRLVSASSEFGVCVPNDDDGGLFRATHTVTCSLDVPAASPGNRVTATITVIAPDPGTLTTMFSLVTGAADPDSTNNTVSSTTVVRTVGGRAFGIALAPAGGVLLTWATGQAQAGYFVGRLVDGVHTVYPKNGVPLPPGATSFVDAAPVPGRTNCYVVSPIDGTGAEIGRSELLCIVPGSESGAGASLQFTLRVFQINQVGAGLTWRPPGGQTSYWLGTHDVESGDSGGRTLAATATSFAELTFGRATCYQLVPLNGSTAMMRSPLACVVPGYGTLP